MLFDKFKPEMRNTKDPVDYNNHYIVMILDGVCVCVCVCVSVCLCLRAYVSVFAWMCMCTCVCVHACLCVYNNHICGCNGVQ